MQASDTEKGSNDYKTRFREDSNSPIRIEYTSVALQFRENLMLSKLESAV